MQRDGLPDRPRSRVRSACPIFGSGHLTTQTPVPRELAILHTGTRLRWRRSDPAPAGSPASCRWFVDVYSDYRDGRLDPGSRDRAEAHLAACSSCRRYHRVIRSGVSVLRADEGGFVDGTLAVTTVRHRAWEQDRREAMALGPAGSGIATAGVVLIALLLGSFAWIPLVYPGAPEVEIAPVAAVAPTVEPMPAYSWSRRASALLPLRPAARLSAPVPVLQAGPVRVPLTPGVAAGVDPD